MARTALRPREKRRSRRADLDPPAPRGDCANKRRSDKHYRGGTHRSVAPELTLERLQPLLSGMGITRVANITGLDRIGIPTVVVVRPNSRSVAVAQGKGLDLPEAKASGIMEAAETFHAEAMTLPVRYASRIDMAREHCLADVDRLPRLTPDALPADRPILWVEGRDLTDGSSRWIPFEVASTDYTLPLPPGSGVFQATTNGLASGNTFAEAHLHAICELIERDAGALWHLGGAEARRRTRLALESVDDPAACELLGRFAAAQVAVGLWEVTSDIGLACFIALTAGSGDGVDPELGAGCHPSRGVALCRAMAEAAQARLAVISGARDDLLPALYTPTARRQRAERARAWLASPDAAYRRFEEVPELATDSSAADLAVVLARLAAAGLSEVVSVDLSQPSFAVPVVRIVVPGLEGPHGERKSVTPGRRAQILLERLP